MAKKKVPSSTIRASAKRTARRNEKSSPRKKRQGVPRDSKAGSSQGRTNQRSRKRTARTPSKRKTTRPIRRSSLRSITPKKIRKTREDAITLFRGSFIKGRKPPGKAKIVAKYARKFIKQSRKKARSKNEGEVIYLKLRGRINGKLEYKTVVLVSKQGKKFDLDSLERELEDPLDDLTERYKNDFKVGKWTLRGITYERYEKVKLSKQTRSRPKKKKTSRGIRR